VLGGMGLIVLHSGHFSKIFKKLMGTTCDLKWRHDDTERLWVVAPGHPIAEGIGEYIELEEEMYGEHFELVRRGGGLQERPLLPARRGPHLLLPPGPRGEPLLPQPGRAPRHSERGPLGRPHTRSDADLRQHGAAGVGRSADQRRAVGFSERVAFSWRPTGTRMLKESFCRLKEL
jgi:hypothetical protein